MYNLWLTSSSLGLQPSGLIVVPLGSPYPPDTFKNEDPHTSRLTPLNNTESIGSSDLADPTMLFVGSA